MRLKNTFLTHTIAGSQIMVPVGESSRDFKGFVRNNETAAFLVDLFKKDITKEDAVEALLQEYDVDPDRAVKAVEYVIDKLQSLNAFE